MVPRINRMALRERPHRIDGDEGSRTLQPLRTSTQFILSEVEGLSTGDEGSTETRVRR